MKNVKMAELHGTFLAPMYEIINNCNTVELGLWNHINDNLFEYLSHKNIFFKQELDLICDYLQFEIGR